MAIRWALQGESTVYENTGVSFDATNWVTAVLGLPNGDFVTGSRDSQIRLYGREDGALKNTLSGHESGITSLSLSPAGNLLSGSWDGTGKVWNLTVSRICNFEIHFNTHSPTHSLQRFGVNTFTLTLWL